MHEDYYLLITLYDLNIPSEYILFKNVTLTENALHYLLQKFVNIRGKRRSTYSISPITCHFQEILQGVPPSPVAFASLGGAQVLRTLVLGLCRLFAEAHPIRLVEEGRRHRCGDTGAELDVLKPQRPDKADRRRM